MVRSPCDEAIQLRVSRPALAGPTPLVRCRLRVPIRLQDLSHQLIELAREAVDLGFGLQPMGGKLGGVGPGTNQEVAASTSHWFCGFRPLR